MIFRFVCAFEWCFATSRLHCTERALTAQRDTDVFGVKFEYGRYDIAHLTLAILYLILFTYTAVILGKLFCGRAALIKWQRVLFVMALLGSVGRIAYFALAIPIRESKLRLPSHVLFLVNSMPAFLFFVCFLIVLFVWAELYHTAKAKPGDLRDPSFRIRSLRPVFLTIIFLIYVAIAVLYILDFTLFESQSQTVSVTNNLAEMSIVAFDALLYFASAMGFFIYGTVFMAELRKTGAKMFSVQSRRQRIVLEVQIITIVMTLCFLVRAGLTIWQVFTSVALSAVWFADLLYFSLLELMPMGLLIVILRPRQVVANYVVASASTFSPIINTTYR